MPVQGRSICGPVDQIASLSNATSLPAPSDSDRHVGSCRMGVSKKKPREKGRTRIPLGGGVIPEPESFDLSARRRWATAQPTDSDTCRLGRGPTSPPWVKVARRVRTFRLWYEMP